LDVTARYFKNVNDFQVCGTLASATNAQNVSSAVTAEPSRVGCTSTTGFYVLGSVGTYKNPVWNGQPPVYPIGFTIRIATL
jgi:hypothetical protein